MSYWFLIIVIGIILALVFVFELLFGKKAKKKYEYLLKNHIMTKSEEECFRKLVSILGDTHHVFPQVHLPTFLEHKIRGQDWYGAFRHIDEKSVDFVICDKELLAPKIAIELDDRSHDRPDRQERDKEVERIMNVAKIPLKRLKQGDLINLTKDSILSEVR